jgi:hypothetical protein
LLAGLRHPLDVLLVDDPAAVHEHVALLEDARLVR